VNRHVGGDAERETEDTRWRKEAPIHCRGARRKRGLGTQGARGKLVPSITNKRQRTPWVKRHIRDIKVVDKMKLIQIPSLLKKKKQKTE